MFSKRMWRLRRNSAEDGTMTGLGAACIAPRAPSQEEKSHHVAWKRIFSDPDPTEANSKFYGTYRAEWRRPGKNHFSEAVPDQLIAVLCSMWQKKHNQSKSVQCGFMEYLFAQRSSQGAPGSPLIFTCLIDELVTARQILWRKRGLGTVSSSCQTRKKIV